MERLNDLKNMTRLQSRQVCFYSVYKMNHVSEEEKTETIMVHKVDASDSMVF